MLTAEMLIELLENGRGVRRKGWNNTDNYIKQIKETKYTDSFTVMRGPNMKDIPWLMSQADLKADDWEIVQ